MMTYEFSLSTPVKYNWCGKFEAPNPKWMHLTRDLLDFELFVVTEGTLYVGDHKGEYAIGKGEFFLMAPTPYQHGFQSSDCMFYWLHFFPTSKVPDRGSDFLPADPHASAISDGCKFYNTIDTDHDAISFYDDSILVPTCGALSAADRMIVLMKQLQDCDKRYHDHLINNYLTSSILCEIKNQSTLYKKSGVDEKSRLYIDIVDYISWHVCENIKVSEIADYFGYNEKYLSTFFHKMSGTPLKQFILQSKMDHAKAELSDTNRTVAQIAYNNGFSDPHNFANAFKKITGLTPTEYRISYTK